MSLSLPSIFGNHMVLQRGQAIRLFGRALPSALVSVDCLDLSETAQADSQGRWLVALPALPALQVEHAFSIHVRSGTDHIQFDDVVLGDVWLLTGQSNLQFPLWKADGGVEAIAASGCEQIRLYEAERAASTLPQDALNGLWAHCSPSSVENFSAVGYWFAEQLVSELKQPIGLVSLAWGGTHIEAWMSAEALAGHRPTAESNRDEPGTKNGFSNIYNVLLAPLVPLAFKGLIWYQGESNAKDPAPYERLLQKMLLDWRARFDHDFQILIAQLPEYDDPERANSQEEWAAIREAQAAVASRLPHAACVPLLGLGDLHDIHPTNKRPVGQRLAAHAIQHSISYGHL